MDAKTYQTLAARTECDQYKSRQRLVGTGPGVLLADVAVPNDSPGLRAVRVNHAIIGLAAEAGELSMLFDPGTTLSQVVNGVVEEGGDCLWYLALFANTTQWTLPPFPELRRWGGGGQNPMESLRFDSAVLCRHVGAMAGQLQKWVYYDQPDALSPTLQQVCGVFATLEDMSNVVGVPMAEWADRNIAKLKVRYPSKYTDWNAAEGNRDRGAESAALSR